MSLTIQENLARMNRTFEVYAGLFRKGREEALKKTTSELSKFAFYRIRRLMPPAGFITSQNLARMEHGGGGTKLSDRAKEIIYKRYGVVGVNGKLYMQGAKARGFTKNQSGKIQYLLSRGLRGGMVLQALMTEQELKMRESHRGFAAAAVLFRDVDKPGKAITYSRGRKASKLGQAAERETGSRADAHQYFELAWGPFLNKFSGQAGSSLVSPKVHAEIVAALNDARHNMRQYIAKKLRPKTNLAAQ